MLPLGPVSVLGPCPRGRNCDNSPFSASALRALGIAIEVQRELARNGCLHPCREFRRMCAEASLEICAERLVLAKNKPAVDDVCRIRRVQKKITRVRSESHASQPVDSSTAMPATNSTAMLANQQHSHASQPTAQPCQPTAHLRLSVKCCANRKVCTGDLRRMGQE